MESRESNLRASIPRMGFALLDISLQSGRVQDIMRELKDTKRATVHIGFDGRVHKRFQGPSAQLRYENEVRILRYLEHHACPFVPRVMQEDPEHLYLVTSNCGAIVDSISDEKAMKLFKELEDYGVIHGDPFPRNITYSPHLGRFCIIDFEFATIKDTGEGLTIEDLERMEKQS